MCYSTYPLFGGAAEAICILGGKHDVHRDENGVSWTGYGLGAKLVSGP